MDPYLENPYTFADFHHEMISGIRAELNRVLMPKYVVRIEERVYIADESDPENRLIVPDLKVMASWRDAKRASGGTKNSSVATLDTIEPIVAVTFAEVEMHEYYLTIIDVESRHVVTVIEILSPFNKHGRSTGRGEYMKKRREVLLSPSHLVEIDLLRQGTSPFPRDALPEHHYAVHVSRAESRPKGTIWPILLRHPLPVIDIPLQADDSDAKLNLQSILNDAYDRGGYEIVVDYEQPSKPPLPPEWDERAMPFRRAGWTR
jgi:hypothetical protein